MASEWEMAMGVELGMGLGGYYNASNATGGAGTPMSHHAGNYSAAAHHFYGMEPVGDADMRVDELLDLSLAGAHDFSPAAADNGSHHLCAVPGEPSAATPSATSSDHQTSMLSFADEFYIPREEAAELEWLSKFVDDSYSDMPNYSSAAHAAMAAAANNGSGSSAGQHSCVTTTVPGRGARSKRSRASAAAAAAWHSLMPHPPSQGPSPSSSCSSSDFPSSTAARPNNVGSRGRKQGPSSVIGGEVGLGLVEGGVRRCTHCASEKTPQWRTGPLGPKTLCNACGVRFKSGRLVPEYRPAASPTFLLTQHSNSHRKVMELRRQKEFVPIRGSHRVDAGGAVAAGAGAAVTVKQELMFRDYGIC